MLLKSTLIKNINCNDDSVLVSVYSMWLSHMRLHWLFCLVSFIANRTCGFICLVGVYKNYVSLAIGFVLRKIFATNCTNIIPILQSDELIYSGRAHIKMSWKWVFEKMSNIKRMTWLKIKYKVNWILLCFFVLSTVLAWKLYEKFSNVLSATAHSSKY